MTKPVADWVHFADATPPEEPHRQGSILGDIYSGFSKISFNPTPGLRKFRCQLEAYSGDAVKSAWSGTGRALAAMTSAEMHVHEPEVYKAIGKGKPWEPHPNQTSHPRPRREPDAVIILEGPHGPVEVVFQGESAANPEKTAQVVRILKDPVTRNQILRILVEKRDGAQPKK